MPTDEDIKRIKESTERTFGMFAYWILYTGCRRGEMLALRWDDEDTELRSVRISKSLYHDLNKPITKKPKSAAGIRTVSPMAKLLEKITPDRGQLFATTDGGLITEMRLQKLWKAYIEESGVTCTPHQIRHA